jgi:hypothetical protein
MFHPVLSETDEELLPAYTDIAFHTYLKFDDKDEDYFFFGMRLRKFFFTALESQSSRDNDFATTSINRFSISEE